MDTPMQISLDDHVELLADLELARRDRDRAVEEFERLRGLVLKLMPDATEAPDGVVCCIGGLPKVAYTPSTMRHLNQQMLRESYPTVIQACTTHVTRWSLRIIGDTL